MRQPADPPSLHRWRTLPWRATRMPAGIRVPKPTAMSQPWACAGGGGRHEGMLNCRCAELHVGRQACTPAALTFFMRRM